MPRSCKVWRQRQTCSGTAQSTRHLEHWSVKAVNAAEDRKRGIFHESKNFVVEKNQQLSTQGLQSKDQSHTGEEHGMSNIVTDTGTPSQETDTLNGSAVVADSDLD
jgi:hypothetical protein